MNQRRINVIAEAVISMRIREAGSGITPKRLCQAAESSGERVNSIMMAMSLTTQAYRCTRKSRYGGPRFPALLRPARPFSEVLLAGYKDHPKVSTRLPIDIGFVDR
jgi:hypothetical protein